MSTQYQIRGATARAIAESIELGIDAGRIPPGRRLPTIRALADDLGVSPTTVNAAFALLRAHGRIAGNRRGGSFALGRSVFQSARVEAPPPVAHDLSTANPDPAFLPAIAAAVGLAAERQTRRYGVADSPQLLALARGWFAADGIDGEHLAVVNGAMDGIERALQAHVVAGDAIALEDPTYPPYRELARALGLRVIPVAIDERGLIPESLAAALRKRVRAVVLIPRGQNPTGAAIDRTRRRALRTVLAEALDVAVIEDDFLSSVSGVAYHGIAGRGRWAVVRSVGKILGPDLRLAVLAGDPLTVGRVRDRQRIGPGWVTHLVQETVASLLADPATARLFAAAERIYAHRRAACVSALGARGVAVVGNSGITLWIPVAEETATAAALLARGWAVDAGERYRISGVPAIRIATTMLEPKDALRFAADLSAIAVSGAGLRP